MSQARELTLTLLQVPPAFRVREDTVRCVMNGFREDYDIATGKHVASLDHAHQN
jgi:hypothetical protein